MAAEYGSLPFAEALDYLRRKLALPTERWDDLLGAAHDRAFVVAGAMQADLLADLQAAVVKVREQGATLAEFRRDFDRIVAERGWTGWTGEESKGGRAWRSRLIYETNLQTSYQAGRYQQMKAVANRRPYWRYRHNDAVVTPRPEHLAWDGKVLRNDDPWWITHYPPNGWNCFAAGTEVATPNGWRAIETLRRGDCVIGGSGNIQTVDAPQIRPFDGDVIRVVTEQGEVSATPNHRFLTLRGWIRAENLQPDEILVQIPEVPRLDSSVGNIQHSDAASAQFGMARPFHRSQASRSKTFDPGVDFWKKSIDPIGEEAFVVGALESPFRHVLQQQSFAMCRTMAGVDMRGRIGLMQALFRLCHLGANFLAERGRCDLQFFRTPARYFIRFLGFAKPVVATFCRLLQSGLAQNFGGSFPSGVVVRPLQANAFAAAPGCYAEMPHQSHDGSRVTAPSFAQSADWSFLFDVADSEGFASGAPLDSFDSLEDFVSWAGAHCHLSKTISVCREQYTGKVYNLSIIEDASYCLRIGVVHNCRCYVETLSERDVQRLGIEPETGDAMPYSGTVEQVVPRTGEVVEVPDGVDRGWDYAPGANATTPLVDLLVQKKTVWPESLSRAVLGFLKPALPADRLAALAAALGLDA